MKLKITVAALAIASISEFLLAYPYPVTVEEKSIEVFRDENDTFAMPKNPSESDLDNLMEWLGAGDESIRADWNMHCEREEYLANTPDLPTEEDEQDIAE